MEIEENQNVSNVEAQVEKTWDAKKNNKQRQFVDDQKFSESEETYYNRALHEYQISVRKTAQNDTSEEIAGNLRNSLDLFSKYLLKKDDCKLLKAYKAFNRREESLNQRLFFFKKTGNIDKCVIDALDRLRFITNNAHHGDDVEATKEDLQEMQRQMRSLFVYYRDWTRSKGEALLDPDDFSNFYQPLEWEITQKDREPALKKMVRTINTQYFSSLSNTQGFLAKKVDLAALTVTLSALSEYAISRNKYEAQYKKFLLMTDKKDSIEQRYNFIYSNEMLSVMFAPIRPLTDACCRIAKGQPACVLLQETEPLTQLLLKIEDPSDIREIEKHKTKYSLSDRRAQKDHCKEYVIEFSNKAKEVAEYLNKAIRCFWLCDESTTGYLNVGVYDLASKVMIESLRLFSIYALNNQKDETFIREYDRFLKNKSVSDSLEQRLAFIDETPLVQEKSQLLPVGWNYFPDKRNNLTTVYRYFSSPKTDSFDKYRSCMLVLKNIYEKSCNFMLDGEESDLDILGHLDENLVQTGTPAYFKEGPMHYVAGCKIHLPVLSHLGIRINERTGNKKIEEIESDSISFYQKACDAVIDRHNCIEAARHILKSVEAFTEYCIDIGTDFVEEKYRSFLAAFGWQDSFESRLHFFKVKSIYDIACEISQMEERCNDLAFSMLCNALQNYGENILRPVYRYNLVSFRKGVRFQTFNECLYSLDSVGDNDIANRYDLARFTEPLAPEAFVNKIMHTGDEK